MKKTNFTFRIFEKCLTAILIMTAMFLLPSQAQACEMSCGGKQQVSLDENCEAEITAAMILSDGGASCPGATFTVAAKLTMNGPAFLEGSTIILDGTYIGQELVIEITSDDGGIINKCWGFIELEDKLAPTIECIDVTVGCADLAELLPTFVGTECDPSPVITLLDQSEESLCDPDYLKQITRTYIATDVYGNTSDPCTQIITVERFDADAVDYPINRMLVDNNALACDGDYEKLPNGNPDPSVTGVPELDGVDLYPPADFSCNTVVSFSDLVLPEVACVTKIMRTWTISEWVCGQDEVYDSIQIIEVVDDAGPDITEVNDVSISTTTGYECQALYLLPPVEAVDNCKEINRIDIAYPGGFISDYDGSEIITLGIGYNDILITAYDGCFNSSTEEFTVTVEDNTAPVAVCDQNTVVALSTEGYTNVSATSFDDGSYDECDVDYFLVKRMDDGTACGEDWDTFGEYVTFCCDDIGNNPVVIFRVYDVAGNYNECMVNVEVQDKLPPTITPPPNMTVDCDFVFDDDEAGLIAAFGDATFADNCAGSLSRSASSNINQCNTGTLIRTFVASDANGSAVAQQNIYFVNNELFDGKYDIAFPVNVTITDCLDLEPGMATEDLAAVHPDVTGRPVISEDACDMVGADYDDKVFEIFNAQTASCFKIIRTWSVVDWCQTDPETGRFLTWKRDQVIEVLNTEAPTLEISCDPITKCTFDGECNDGEVVLRMAASDDCTPASAISWQYSIDADNDGDFDFISGIISGSVDSINGVEVSVIDATGDYPIGSHRIVWSAEDRCGNKTTCEQLFTVENCKTPTPYCIHGLAIDIMGVDTDDDGVVDDGMIDIWASDFDAGSFHQCGYDVTVSFSSDPTDVGRTYTCADVGIVEVDIWATAILPDGTVVQDFCSTYVDVQNNLNVCGGGENMVLVGGTVATEMEESIEEVMVTIDGTDMIPEMTDTEGNYEFRTMQEGASYGLHPQKKTDLMNGVTTFDLVMIQRHILGLIQLDSPYKIIAADIDNNQTVSAKDLLNLRKAILGITNKFDNNDSWRFVDKGYDFINPTNPLTEQFTEIYNINDLQSDMTIDFVGVKVGDVNASVIANSSMNATVRNNSTLQFYLNEQTVAAGEIIEVPVYAENFNNMLAYQFSMELADNLQFIDVKAGALDLTEANFGLQALENGIVTTSWNSYNAVSLEEGTALFTITIQALNDVELNDAIAFNSSITKAEAYTETETLNVRLETRENPTANAEFRLYQNTPNPFNGVTNVKFDLPEAGNASLNIYDVTGKLIHSVQNQFNKGENNIELDVNEIGARGVLYYTLQTDDHTATKKMVVLK